ncbi:hypothetical protein [Rhizobium sp.]|uniref:hypothetical protein n=1 Tax=Rhizobium sp. TaxID=391 RepID=UPI003F7FB058
MSKLEELIAELEKAGDLGSRVMQDVMFACGIRDYDTAFHRILKLVECGAQIDAAVALVNRVLPGWFWRGGNVPAGKYERGAYQHGWGHISKTDASNCDRDDEFTGWAATPELALCIAVLRAKLAQEEA